jgi:hypothetical protein
MASSLSRWKKKDGSRSGIAVSCVISLEHFFGKMDMYIRVIFDSQIESSSIYALKGDLRNANSLLFFL